MRNPRITDCGGRDLFVESYGHDDKRRRTLLALVCIDREGERHDAVLNRRRVRWLRDHLNRWLTSTKRA